MAEGKSDQQKRQPAATERGIEYQLDLKARNFKGSVTSWRRKANKLRAALVDDVVFSDVKTLRDGLQELMDNVIETQENLSELRLSSTIADDSGDKLEEVEKEHSSIMKSTLDRIIALKTGERNDDASSSQGDTTTAYPPVGEGPTLDPLSIFAEQLRASRLPLPEPTAFDGDPLLYPGWKHAFDVIIDHSGINPIDRFLYLEKYLKGQPLELVRGYALIDNETAYLDVRTALEERYGNPSVIANAFRDKLEKWPRITSKDAPGLRKLSDFLRQCVIAMDKINHLRHLNDDREIRKILSKLPEWLIVRWSRKAYQWSEDNNSFPPFKLFARFLEEESKIACCPITSVHSLKESRSERGRSAALEVRALATDATTSRNQKGKTDQRKQGPISCLVCKKSHTLEECPTFLAWEMVMKKKLITEKGLCYGCLKVGHRSKECKRRSTCQNCKKRHPTALHFEDQGKAQSSNQYSNQFSNQDTVQDEVRSSSSHTARKSEARETPKSSMIVPVWLSHPSTNESRLVYALLDTQSDTTFILDRTKQAMGLRGTSVNLRLSTMSAVNERVNSIKVEGLEITSHDGKHKIGLPPSYTRKMIPANRNHIPTSDMASSIPHLSRLQDEIPADQGCEIGLLIGYDCPKALMPRDVIPSSTSDGRFGVRTDLGWSIVGTVDENYDSYPNDPIGVSHRVKVCVIPDDVKGIQGHEEVSFSHRRLVKEEIALTQVVKLLEADFMQGKESKPYSQNDVKFLKRMKEGIHKDKGGQYEMPLPLTDENLSLPNNIFLAEKRLSHLKKRFQRDPEYHTLYNEKMTSLFDNNTPRL
ncbi:uncharacterized protein LOC129282656 [Lytechinus pictus]|uniref:uncharacterized protein LOC129282656 n=1 Tax=Lytechinus pictus TaxID=7653 RepID=UPI0030BA2262